MCLDRLTCEPTRGAADTMPNASADNPLSPREGAALRPVAESLAERTVESDLSGAMNKVGAFTRAQVIALRHDDV